MASHGNSPSPNHDADEQPEGSAKSGQMEIDANNEEEEEEEEEEQIPSGPTSLPSSVDYAALILKRSTSDTEKLAALLVVTKLIKAEELTDSDKQKLIDAVGLQFLARLLRTDEVPEGCPPHMFKSIALTILTCFISSCLGNPLLHCFIPILSEIISKPEMYDDDLTLLKDSFQCLSCMATDEGNRKALIDYKAIGLIVDTYTKDGLCSEDALNVLVTILGEEGVQTWKEEPEAATRLMNHLAHEFAVDQGELKFKLCDILAEILPSVPEPATGTGTDIVELEWKQTLHKGLSDIILNKVGREQRNSGLRLAMAAMNSLGVTWVLQPTPAPTEKTRGRQLLLMLVHLSCIEVRMSLEDRTFADAVALALPTTSCYNILEMAIIFLVTGAAELEQKQKQQLYAALKGAFNAVLTFLKEASLDNSILGNLKNHLFLCATIRVLAAWLAEETSANKAEVYDIVPFIIKISKYNFDHNSRRSILAPKQKGLSKLQNTEAYNTDQLPDILRFLLPGLCHLTAEDDSRHILLIHGSESLLFEYLNYQWDSIKEVYGPHYKDEEPQVPQAKLNLAMEAMDTISNIFMNIVVQEPERVASHMFYYSLLKYIFTKVPELPLEVPHLRLCGNMCTLGLMILRHQHMNVKSTDFTIFRFVQTAVRYLWDAHNVEESRDYATLVLSSRYASHWESMIDSWFLSMHTLSILLPTIPWLNDFLIESEWPQTVVATLLTVREGGLETGLKSAFEDFLCLLARSSKPAYTIIKEKGVEQVCRNHKLEELSKVFGVKLA